MYTVRIRDLDDEIVVDEGERILAVALEENLPYPHGCKSGNCGACKSVLHSGRVRMASHSPLALTEEEEARGLILACRSEPLEDCEVSFARFETGVDHPVERLQGTVTAVERLSHDTVRIVIETERPLAYSAGQYASLTFEGQPPRDYSMASLSGGPVLDFFVREIPGGPASTFANRELAPGRGVVVEGPFGTSTLREEHRGPILALAGSSGIAPVKAIVERALQAGMRQPIRLVFGVRAEHDVYLEDHLTRLGADSPNLSVEIVLSEPEGETSRRTGTVADVIAADAPDLDGAKVYLAGPPPMVDGCVEVVRRLGVRDDDIHADAFVTEADRAREG